jgi:hypothetical protein
VLPCARLLLHPSRHSAGQPIVAGWAYQWIAQLGFDRDSWTAPVDAARLHPLDDTDQTAAGQVRALLDRLPTGGPAPLFVFDGGYDSAQLSLDLADAPAAVLVRLRSDRCFYADPPPRRPGATGRPRRHGAKFNCADPSTWPTSTATLVCHDDQYGTVTVKAWSGLHPKQQRHPGHGTRRPRPIVRGTVICVQVERVPARTRPPKVLWLWWAGPAGLQLDLDLAWRAYVRRFDLEHTIRFCKQTLGWPTPRPRHPEQADRWTWLVLAGYTQLRLARAVAGDQRLPWERPDPNRACHRSGSAAAFRSFWSGRARRQARRNPPDAHQAGPKAAARDPRPATRRSRSLARRRPSFRRPPDRTVRWHSADLGQANSASRRVKSQAKSLISLLGGPFRAENGAGCPLTSLLFGR